MLGDIEGEDAVEIVSKILDEMVVSLRGLGVIWRPSHIASGE